METKLYPYVRQLVRRAYINVVGKNWYGQPIGTTYQLRDHDLENIGEFTRNKVEQWLTCHAGDFQVIEDFEAVCGSMEIDFATEDSLYLWSDLMYGPEGE